MFYSRTLAVSLFILFLAVPVQATYLDDVGYTALVAELGTGVPTGAGISMSQVEAASSENYSPDTAASAFWGKTFTLMSGASGVSSHATTVGTYLYGNSGMAKGVTAIKNWEANDWVSSGFLKTGTNSSPALETQRVQNNSWVGSFGNDDTDQDAVRRFDFTINRDNYVAVVGLNNGSNTTVPNLLAANYNAITVGVSSGIHSRGTTLIDTKGRVKPDIVAPAAYTSYATPIVGAAAAILLQKADSSSIYTNARNSESIKAILMAGATKEEFATWDRTQTRPLDDIYGAGELNVYNSYHILAAGEQNASTSSDAHTTGWDFDACSSSQNKYYFIDVGAGTSLTDVSIILTWNRVITDGIQGGNWGSPQASLADLDLYLYSAEGYSVRINMDRSISDYDNVEHIYQPNLSAGRYAIVVTSSSATSTDFSLAWRSTVEIIPEPATLLLIVGVGGVLLLKGRRRLV
ncbi:MAG: PEP-CTERM sorting domain-containing protein [Planctomycetaceae bacterium]|nr:PEP-CTERM sorting domain-containing protein [Planctomycetaceae bacterium]